jgi:hypothetical protein
MSCGLKFLGRLEACLRAEIGPDVVAAEQGLELTHALPRERVALDLEFERLLEPSGNGDAHSHEKL